MNLPCRLEPDPLPRTPEQARWLIDHCRRTPGTAPRCEASLILSAHDAGQQLLVQKGWLPVYAIAKGSSCAKLAQTFPEEMCPSY